VSLCLDVIWVLYSKDSLRMVCTLERPKCCIFWSEHLYFSNPRKLCHFTIATQPVVSEGSTIECDAHHHLVTHLVVVALLRVNFLAHNSQDIVVAKSSSHLAKRQFLESIEDVVRSFHNINGHTEKSWVGTGSSQCVLRPRIAKSDLTFGFLFGYEH